MTNIFLSHATEDRELAAEFKKQIVRVVDGVSIFVSSTPDGIRSGDWLAVVLAKLDNAEIFVPLITPLAEKSAWVIYEYGYYWGQKGKNSIFPLHHPKAHIPSPLNTLQSKSITDPHELEVFFRTLCHTLSF